MEKKSDILDNMPRPKWCSVCTVPSNPLQPKGSTEMARTKEQGHVAKCLAHAMICAIENMRDSIIDDVSRQGYGSEMTVHDFRVWAQDNGALEWAEQYLDDGTATCICPVYDFPVSISDVETELNKWEGWV